MVPSVRKILFHEETAFAEAGHVATRPIRRVAAIAVIANPHVATYIADLSALFDIGGVLGERLMPELARRLGGTATSYGKAAIVGINGEFEHGAAVIHPKLGRPMRDAVGGGKALIPANVKLAPAGTPIDLPLGHKDDPWSFDYIDTWTIAVADAPRPDELVILMALADGGRVRLRSGSGPMQGGPTVADQGRT